MSGSSFTIAAATKAAENLGQAIVLPAADELFIDIDSDEDAAIFEKHLEILGDEGFALGAVTTVSKSGWPHRHSKVKLARPVTALERITLQAMLGSDRKHELLSWIALEKGTTDSPSVFFE